MLNLQNDLSLFEFHTGKLFDKLFIGWFLLDDMNQLLFGATGGYGTDLFFFLMD